MASASYGGEPDVSVDPTDPARLVYTSNSGAYWSADGGSTWTVAEGIVGLGDNNDEFDRRGGALASSSAPEPGGTRPSSLLVYRSSDHGASYGPPAVAADAATQFLLPDGSFHAPCFAQPSSPLYDYPKLSADRLSGHDRVFLQAQAMFNPFGQGCNQNHGIFVHSDDGGATWTDPVLVSAGGTKFEDIAVGPDGSAYLAGGLSGACVMGLTLWRYTLLGEFDERCDSGAGLVGRAWVTADPADATRLWVAYEGSAPGARHIFVVASTDGGATWRAPVRVDDVTLPEVDHLAPTMAVSAGRLHLAWWDFRHSPPGDVTKADVYYSSSTDGGATWTPNLRLSAENARTYKPAGNDYFNLVATPDHAYVAFAQDRDDDGRWELYLGDVEAPLEAAGASAASGPRGAGQGLARSR